MENIVTSHGIIMKKNEYGVICVDVGMPFVLKTSYAVPIGVRVKVMDGARHGQVVLSR